VVGARVPVRDREPEPVWVHGAVQGREVGLGREAILERGPGARQMPPGALVPVPEQMPPGALVPVPELVAALGLAGAVHLVATAGPGARGAPGGLGVALVLAAGRMRGPTASAGGRARRTMKLSRVSGARPGGHRATPRMAPVRVRVGGVTGITSGLRGVSGATSGLRGVRGATSGLRGVRGTRVSPGGGDLMRRAHRRGSGPQALSRDHPGASLDRGCRTRSPPTCSTAPPEPN
jgi:hypothetical protein